MSALTLAKSSSRSDHSVGGVEERILEGSRENVEISGPAAEEQIRWIERDATCASFGYLSQPSAIRLSRLSLGTSARNEMASD